MQKLGEDLTLSQLQHSPVSQTTSKYADERATIMGDDYNITQLIEATYHQSKDYILAKFLTEATDKYSDDHQYKDVSPTDFSLNYDPSATYELWVMFYPVKQTASINGLEFNKEGIKQVLPECYVKVWSNAPSFHWQGFNYNLSKKKASLFPTNIRPTKWDKVHGNALLDKHLYQALTGINKYYDEISSKALTNLKESVSMKDKVVFSIGRMNPYTKGHEKLVDKIIATAQSIQADAVLFITQSQDSTRNPLSWEQKVAFISEACKSKPITICRDKDVKSPFDAAIWLNNRQYKHMVAIFGEDRLSEMEAMYNKYNDKDTSKGKYSFETIQVVSAGGRDPDSEDIEGFSSTKARNAAIDGDFETFYNIIGTPDKTLAKNIFISVQKGMGIEEALYRLKMYSRMNEDYQIPLESLVESFSEVPLHNIPSIYEFYRIKFNEGGAATGSDRIKKENIEPTLEKFIPILESLVPDAQWAPIGSTGKKPENGDIDLAVQTSKSLSEIASLFKGKDLSAVENKGLGEVSIKFQQYSPEGIIEGKSVQIDLMVGDLEWLTFMYRGYGPEDTAFKPLARTACLYALLRFSAEEILEDGTVTFYSLSPNKGAFLKSGKEVDGKLEASRVNSENISDPSEVASLVSKKSGSPWSVNDLIQPIEFILAKINKDFEPDLAKKIKGYISDFLDKQKLEGPANLREAKTSHLTHVEDLIIDEGKKGALKTIEYLEHSIDSLEGNTPSSKIRTTVKMDGAPSIVIGESYPNVSGPFVGMKNTFSPKAPQIFQTPEEIDARYGDKPDLANKLKIALQYAPSLGIPEGEVWKGDFLFTKDDLEVVEEGGKTWVTFQPNTLIYAVDANSDAGKKILNSEMGIVFHSKYSGDDLRTAESTASFDVDISLLNDLPAVFLIDANLPNLAGKITLTLEETLNAKRILKNLKADLDLCGDLADEISSTSSYNTILNQFENYAVKKGFQFSDKERYVTELLNWIQFYFEKDAAIKKTDKGRAQTLSKSQSIKKFFAEERRVEFEALIEFQHKATLLKKIILDKLNPVPSLNSFIKDSEGHLKSTGHEGFAVSDIEGNIIKLVDRLEFSRMNLTRHEEDTPMLNDLALEDKIKAKGLALRKKISSKTWIVEDPENKREDKLKDFLRSEGGVPVGLRNIKIGNYTLIFKNQNYVGKGGIDFEKSAVENMTEDNSPLSSFLQSVDLTLEDVKKVEHLGSLNTSRSINFNILETQNTLLSLPSGVSEGDFGSIGDALADARVYLKTINPLSGKPYINVSMKSGKKVTFLNAGIANRGAWAWNKAVFHLCKAFGFSSDDSKSILDGFEQAAETRHTKLELKMNNLISEKRNLEFNGPQFNLKLDNLKRFIDNAIGEDYLMIHDAHSMYIDSTLREKMSRGLKLDRVAFPSSSRARLDIYLQSEGLSQIIINIRAKNEAKLYPTHIMVDYVMRDNLWN